MEDLCLFGFASTHSAEGTGYSYKLLGKGATREDYQLVLEVTNVLTAYIAKFSLQEVVEAVADEAGINAEEAMMGWLKQHFDGGQLEAVPASGGGGLQVVAQHSEAALGADVCLRLPPLKPAARVDAEAHAVWVTQDVLFTQTERLRGLQRKLQACEERCPPSQQFDDALAFLGSTGSGELAAAPRAAALKRKQEAAAERAAPASGSAVKAPRPNGAAVKQEVAGANGGAAAAGQQPASTQQTGGASTRTNMSHGEVGHKKVVAGRGRGRGVPGGGRGRGRKAGA